MQITTEEEASQIKVLRKKIIDKSSDINWAKDMVGFACTALARSDLIEIKKKNPKIPILIPLIEFHYSKWIEPFHKKAEEEIKRLDKIRQLELREQVRVREAHAQAAATLIPIGIGLGLFFALAIYLIVLRMEGHMREMSLSMKSALKEMHTH